MTSKKYWTSSHKEENKSNNSNKPSVEEIKLSEQQQQQTQHQQRQEKEDNERRKDSMSCSESIEENVVTIKPNNMENENNDANVQTHHHDTTIFRSPHIKRRPDSLKLSFAYGSTSDLGKSVFSNSDVNQTKSLSVDGNKSHHGGKKSTSYDLWVNENALKVANVSDGEGKKLDLAGRVSFR